MTMARLTCAVAAALGVVAVAATSRPRAQTGDLKPAATGLIMGRVIDGSTGRPVAGVIVTLTSGGVVATVPSAPGRTLSQPPRVITDSGGRFLFHDLPAGRYSFSVTGASPLLGGGYGVRRPGGSTQDFELADGERATDVTLRVWKTASVSGTLTDQFNDPVPETKVAVMRVDIVAGRRRYRSPVTALTDDRGVYRISRLEPGEYIAYLPFTQVTVPLSASPEGSSMSGTGFRIGSLILLRESGAYGSDGPVGPMMRSPAPSADGRLVVYPFQYYPSAARPADATPLTLESGQDRAGTDFQVRAVTSVRVSGRLIGPDGPAAAIPVRLVPQAAVDAADESALDAATTITDRSGNFTFLGVPVGQYTIKAAVVPAPPRPQMTSVMTMGPNGGTETFVAVPQTGPPPPLPDAPTLGATMAVAVGDADVANLELVLQSGPRVSGHLEYDGTLTPLTADQVQRLTLSFDPVDGRSFVASSGKGQFDASGLFRSAGLLAGRYVVHVGGNMVGWGLKSAVAGGRDVSDEALVVAGSDIGGVVITLTDHPSLLTGTVRDVTGAADKSALVLVFPVDRAMWMDASTSSRRLRWFRASTKGVYGIPVLPAGDYFVIAVDDQFTAGWQDPKRLETLSRAATRVTIRDGERRAQDLVTARIQ